MLLVEFGSRVRGDSDAFSDRDVLLIGANWLDLGAEKTTWEDLGCSVSCFTWDRAKFLVSNGSLFFKHIIDEGVLVDGSPEQYQELVTAWCPAASYDNEIYENLDVLEVLSFTPRSNLGLNVAVDIIITSVRNILIKRLASKGFYVFAWDSVFHTAAALGEIRGSDVRVFLLARKIKNLYRKDRFPMISNGFVDALSEAAGRVFRIGNIVFFSQRRRISVLPEQFPDGSYKQLRGLELLCAEYAFEPSLADYRLWVKEPSYFCARGSSKRMQLACRGDSKQSERISAGRGM